MKVTTSILGQFRPLLEPARYKGAYGGRGSGKSRFFATLSVIACLRGRKIVCIREVQRSLKYSSKHLIETEIRRSGIIEQFTITNDEIKAKNGSGLIIFTGMQDQTADSIKSLAEFEIAWVEEAHALSHKSMELLRPTIRESGSEIWFSWNPHNAHDAIEFLRHSPPDDSIVIKVSWRDMPPACWPAELEAERLHDQLHNPHRYAHIWEGEYEPAAIGAIWTASIIDRNRIEHPPPLQRIVVGVDPAITSPKNDSPQRPNSTGIIVVGLGMDGLCYVLDDCSRSGTPEEWARATVGAYDKWQADCVIVEVNQGGEMVTHTLYGVRATLPIKSVRASRGKHIRAEPISAQYALDQVKHCGHFDALERELCQITPAGYEGDGSPDRADALVWAITELLPETGARGRVQNPRSANRPAARRTTAGTNFRVLA